MLLIRRFEEKLDELFSSGVIKGTSHLYAGQEAVAVGVCAALENADLMTSTHRGHGHFLAKGGDPNTHVADYSIGFLGSNGITAGGLPIATGAALSAQMRGSGQVVVSFFGEGGANQGTFHESLNMAAIWRLPILFICENNQYAMSTRFDEAFATPDIAARAAGYGFPGEIVDGSDFFAVQNAVEKAATRARNGHGPTLLEAKTYRYYGHSKSDKCEYRTRDEENDWKSRDPIKKLRAKCEISDADFEAIFSEIEAQIKGAVEFARTSPEPEIEDLELELFAA